jgi:threonine dehydrogenase-like Zn-dependent dehydrogenase
VKATVYYAPGDVRVETVPDSTIQEPTDAVVRITHACICGSDLWFYRGSDDWKPGWRTGHEWMGIVETVGSDVRNLKKGDRVLAPFAFSDGSCEFCGKSLQTSCIQGATLVKIPREVENDDALLTAILPLTDVMATGHHAAISAGVQAGSTVAVVGDGAVGLCGVLADVLAGKIDPSPVLDLTVDLDGVPGGYAAMDGREAIKVMVRL